MVAHMVTVPVTGLVADSAGFTITEVDTLADIQRLLTVVRSTIRPDHAFSARFGTIPPTLTTIPAATFHTAITSTTSLVTTTCTRRATGTIEPYWRDEIVGGSRNPGLPPFPLPGTRRS